MQHKKGIYNIDISDVETYLENVKMPNEDLNEEKQWSNYQFIFNVILKSIWYRLNSVSMQHYVSWTISGGN